jgi:predicted DNA-binding antitoxin AbrB/MazE fold protein
MKIKAIYEHEVLKPLEKLDLKDGEEVELMLTKKISERTFGLITLDHDIIEEIIEDTGFLAVLSGRGGKFNNIIS